MTRRWRSLVAAVLLAFAVLTAGCATKPVPDEVRATFGSVAVVAADVPTRIGMEHPTAGWGAGLGMGFVRGLSAIVVWPVIVLCAAGASGGMSGDPGIAGVVILAVIIVVPAACAVVWLPFSVIGGATTALPPDEADRAEAVLMATAEERASSSRLAAVIADSARRRAGREIVARESADTVVEVRLVSVERGASWNWWSFDRPFSIETEAEVKVIRRRDGAVLWDATETVGTTESPVTLSKGAPPAALAKTYLEWAADGGAPFRAEVDSQVASLGARFARFVFGAARTGAPPPSARPADADAPASPAR